eukprot:TRINITY_DN3290_c0_g1_i3.p1 TRINITY_DN3290_c0_g1~~TRINITY_DN3290_c0_g1_i3.p1  ORF type:complete len:665 (-),score=119.66 TRINITY_DN3290_c0_g1_i3:58-2010(-)
MTKTPPTGALITALYSTNAFGENTPPSDGHRQSLKKLFRNQSSQTQAIPKQPITYPKLTITVGALRIDNEKKREHLHSCSFHVVSEHIDDLLYQTQKKEGVWNETFELCCPYTEGFEIVVEVWQYSLFDGKIEKGKVCLKENIHFVNDQTTENWYSIVTKSENSHIKREYGEIQLSILYQLKEAPLESFITNNLHMYTPDFPYSSKIMIQFVPDDQTNIRWKDGDENTFNFKNASLDKLIERLVYPPSPTDPRFLHYENFVRVFFTTYRSFSRSVEVLTKIIERYSDPTAASATVVDEVELAKKEGKINVVCFERLQHWCCITLEYWFTEFYSDFVSETDKNATHLREKLLQFVQKYPHHDFTAATRLSRTVTSKIGAYIPFFESKIISHSSIYPTPDLPEDLSQTTWLHISERELARQLSVQDFLLYSGIQPVELQDLAWTKDKLKARAVNVLELIHNLNQLSSVIATLIVTCPKIKERVAIVDRILSIAKHLYQLNNFNSCMAILSAFQSSSVHRLKHTFEDISKRSAKFLALLEKSLSSANAYKEYRALLESISSPCVPFMGVYLTDLTFIEEGNADTVDNLINFRKKTLEYEIIISVQRFQKIAYNYKLVPQVLHLLLSNRSLSEAELYKISLQIEPRNSKRKDLL